MEQEKSSLMTSLEAVPALLPSHNEHSSKIRFFSQNISQRPFRAISNSEDLKNQKLSELNYCTSLHSQAYTRIYENILK